MFNRLTNIVYTFFCGADGYEHLVFWFFLKGALLSLETFILDENILDPNLVIDHNDLNYVNSFITPAGVNNVCDCYINGRAECSLNKQTTLFEKQSTKPESDSIIYWLIKALGVVTTYWAVGPYNAFMIQTTIWFIPAEMFLESTETLLISTNVTVGGDTLNNLTSLNGDFAVSTADDVDAKALQNTTEENNETTAKNAQKRNSNSIYTEPSFVYMTIYTSLVIFVTIIDML